MGMQHSLKCEASSMNTSAYGLTNLGSISVDRPDGKAVAASLVLITASVAGSGAVAVGTSVDPHRRVSSWVTST